MSNITTDQIEKNIADAKARKEQMKPQIPEVKYTVQDLINLGCKVIVNHYRRFDLEVVYNAECVDHFPHAILAKRWEVDKIFPLGEIFLAPIVKNTCLTKWLNVHLSPTGGETEVRVIFPNGDMIPYSVRCHSKDVYNKKLGVNLALKGLENTEFFVSRVEALH